MAVKHKPTGVVHKGNKGGTTGCGVDTIKNSVYWVDSHQKSLVIKMAVRISFH